ncbi:MAG: DUF72 domain-containing protein [Verrucomicrobiota bacterium]|nr:DUF72 domain-containing protein [Verrucomicrobiota bacterium]
MAGRILVGTASWSDPGFVAHWYPSRLSTADRLGWYAEHFGFVEVNSSFYAVPSAAMAKRWAIATPSGFVFDVKLHQLLSRHATPAKFLPPPLRRVALIEGGRVELTGAMEQAMVESFRPALQILADAAKLGCLLLQLSPSFSPTKHSLAELENLLALLGKFAVAVELRNRHWTDGGMLAGTLSFFRQHRVTFVNVDAPASDHFTVMPSALDLVTRPAISYLRLHGRDAKAYVSGRTVAERFNYNYDDAEIGEIALRARKLASESENVHVVFNNNARDYAPHAALRLRRALGQMVTPPPCFRLRCPECWSPRPTNHHHHHRGARSAAASGIG